MYNIPPENGKGSICKTCILHRITIKITLLEENYAILTAQRFCMAANLPATKYWTTARMMMTEPAMRALQPMRKNSITSASSV